MSRRLQALQEFIDEVRAIWSRESDNGIRMAAAKPAMEKLLADASLRKASEEWPSTEGRKNLLLYVDPDHEFAINAVVRVPGRKGNIHDHGPVWVMYGVLTGTESLERYERIDDLSDENVAQVKLISIGNGVPGKVDIVAPMDIHSEKGGPTRSTAIILRSARLGEIMQGRYDPLTNAVRRGPGPAQIPFEVNA